MSMQNNRATLFSVPLFLTLVGLMLLSGCYHRSTTVVLQQQDKSQLVNDSVIASPTHPYSHNYNFVVKADSLSLIKQQPEEYLNHLPVDTLTVYNGNPLVVADIRIMPTDSIDSVWVQVARDQYTFGWIHEYKLLRGSVPNDPISQFISFFSDTHLLISLIVVCFFAMAYLGRFLFRHNAKMVHFNDIPTFYPTLLCLLVAASATLYTSIQHFAPYAWQLFYYHPTLNPFTVPPLIAIFLISVWCMLLVALAAVDDIRRSLPLGEALLYLLSLGDVCSVNYIIFSVSTLYYVGYPLLVIYLYWATRRHCTLLYGHYLCGQCGKPIRHKGICPHCGANNV